VTSLAKVVRERLSREEARYLLGKIDGFLSSSSGRAARESVVNLLNSRVPSYRWVGVYLVEGSDLMLDAWSGPEATQHVRIPVGRGICGFAAKAGRTEIVSDVTRDPRYLECFPETKSEIVVPIKGSEEVIGEIDVDANFFDAFSSLDREFLEAVARKLVPTIARLGYAEVSQT